MNRPTSSLDAPDRGPDSDLPGGRGLNHAAAVVTSATLGGLAAGALAGSVAGPLGTAIGAAVGAVAAGIAGDRIAEAVDAEAEDAYWREHFRHRPYVDGAASFDDYGPAYNYGVLAFVREPGQPFEDFETELSRDWRDARGRSTLEWDRAREASRDAWERARRGGRE